MSELSKPMESTMPSWVLKMREAAQAAITEADLIDIVKMQVALAKKGNPAALKFVFDQVLGGAALKGATFVQQNFSDAAAEPRRLVDSTEKLSPTELGAKVKLDRHAVEDKTLGLMCDQCGFEPEHSDRAQACPKCNMKRWTHKAGRRMAV